MASAAAAIPSHLLLTGRARTMATVVLVLSTFMVVLDITVANVSVPHIAGSVGASMDQGTWVITSYAVAEAISVPLTGWLVQRFGAVRVYILAMSGFGLFSFVCASSLTLPMIVAARLGQGLCGGLIMPLAQTLLLRIYPPEEVPKALLAWTMTILLGPALGPIVGGYISDNWSWHWIFLINLPIAAACITLAIAMLRPIETETEVRPFDRIGLFLLILWIGALQLMLDLGRTHDWFEDPLIVGFGITAVVGFIAFLIWELTDDHPIVDLRVFRHRGFTTGVMALSLCFGAYFASIVIIPQWLQVWMGYPAWRAGLIAAFTAIAAITTSRLSASMLGRVDARLMVSGAMVWLGLMSLVRSNWTSGSDFWTLAMPQLIQGFAMSFFMMPLTTITLASVDPDETASAAGLQNFIRTLSIAFATAIALTLWDNTQQAARSEIAGNLQPDATVTSLTDAGFSLEQARQMISRIVEQEAVMVSVDYVFLLSGVAFFLSAMAIWLGPKAVRKPGVMADH